MVGRMLLMWWDRGMNAPNVVGWMLLMCTYVLTLNSTICLYVYHRPTWGNGISMQVSNFRSAHTHIQSHTYKHTRWHVAIVVPSHLLLSLSLTQREQSLYLSTDQVGSLSRRRTATVQLIIGAKQGGTGLLKSSHIKRILLFLPLSPPPPSPSPSSFLLGQLICGSVWPVSLVRDGRQL